MPLITGTAVNHAKAYGRIAFSCPFEEQLQVEQKIKATNHKILTPLISLDTPGKATVLVIILADPVRADSFCTLWLEGS